MSGGTCLGCGGHLEQGFLEDAGDSSRGYLRWIPGPLEKGMFGGARRMGKSRVDVQAYRCGVCGLLSLYAGGSPELTRRSRETVARAGSGGLTPPAPSPFADDD